jgi:hypothetical protein
METMADLLEKVREFAMYSFTKEEAQKLFGWNVSEFQVKGTQKDETHVFIVFDNGHFLFIKYFLNLDPTETDDTCEFIFGMKTDLCSRIKYGIHYGNYIHGQGYIRLRVAEMKNRMQQMMLEEFYIPALKNVYKPVIIQFKGLFEKDFFGVEADNASSLIYYAPIRSRSEHKGARIGEVIGRLNELDQLLKEPQIRRDLAEIDFQLSLLPSMMGSGL